MAFEENGEWDGVERWNMARRAILAADGIVEASLQNISVNVDAGSTPRTEAELMAHIETHYYLVDEPASILRAGLFTQAIGHFEYALLFLCVEGAYVINRQNYPQDASRHDVVKQRLRYLGELAGRDFLSGANELAPLQTMRNIATHSVGETFTLNPQRREVIDSQLARWTSDHSALAISYSGGISLNRGFTSYVASYYNALFASLIAPLSTRARVAISTRR